MNNTYDNIIDCIPDENGVFIPTDISKILETLNN